ncbi:MAG TPA: DUF4399 domain-containing protein [Burkholderiales bacterium]|nr:DUF4399 domain-containing protein [Burkholderiales bacterium]
MQNLKNIVITGVVAVSTLAVLGASPVIAKTPAPKDAEVYIISPSDGDTVSSPVTVKFGLKGMGVAPAGVNKPDTGHHHLIIDAGLPALDAPIPASANYKHFGGGQTETSIELAPGKHTLQLIMGDLMHVPHDPPVMSRKITITVK